MIEYTCVILNSNGTKRYLSPFSCRFSYSIGCKIMANDENVYVIKDIIGSFNGNDKIILIIEEYM